RFEPARLRGLNSSRRRSCAAADAPCVEPRAILVVQIFNALAVPVAQKTQQGMHVLLVVVMRSVRSFLDLEQKPLVSLAVFRDSGKSMHFEESLFAREMQAGELDQAVQLFAHLVAAAPVHQRK